MCTASWLIHAEGFELFFNRDESRERLPARPPEPFTVDGLRCLAPADGDAGGTWLGVNELGLAVGLLNSWDVPETEPAGDPISRGLLVRRLLGATSAADVGARIADADLRRHRGFRLVVLAPGREPAVHGWDGRTLATERVVMPLASSALGADRVHRVRAGVLADLASANGGADAETLHAFHRSHAPERGPLSACMHRADARTVSSCHVRVERDEIVFRYAAGPPCKTPFGPPERLERSLDPRAARSLAARR